MDAKTRVRVAEKTVKTLKRGDRILAIRWPGCGKREAGVSQQSPVMGTFLRRHFGPLGVTVDYVKPNDDELTGTWGWEPNSAAFVLEDVTP